MINRSRLVIVFAVIFVINIGLAGIVGTRIINQYQRNSAQEIEVIIGILAKEGFDDLADEVAIVKILQDKSDLAECADRPDNSVCVYQKFGAELLAKYGYRPEDFVSQSAESFVWQTAGLFCVLIAIDVLIIVAWRAVDRYRVKYELDRLSHYFESLTKKQDDLVLKNSRENEFSRLKDELYKTTILLREAAEYNRDSRKKLETALEDISHQLRTPLTALQITLDNLCTNESMPPELEKEFLNTARHQVEGMAELVVTLLNLAKFNNKTIALNPQPVVISQMIDMAISKIAVLAELQDVEITTVGDLSAKIVCDSTWQAEALANIIKNCVEFSPAGEKVEIIAEDCPIFTKIIVRDHGPGISKADQKRIFKRFYQAKGANSNNVGIGLNFAKTIIEAELGHVRVDSELGDGAEFVISYPKR